MGLSTRVCGIKVRTFLTLTASYRHFTTAGFTGKFYPGKRWDIKQKRILTNFVWHTRVGT
jgi:hypothetical protein